MSTFTPKYDLEKISYSSAGWNGIFTTDMEKLDDVIPTRVSGTLAEAVSAFEAVQIRTDGEYEKAMSVSGTNTYVGLAVDTGIASSAIRVHVMGEIYTSLWSWAAIGAPVYVSDTVSGTLTQSVTDVEVGIAIRSDAIILKGSTTAGGGGGGATTLIGLTDTPSGYDDGKYLKSTAAGTEWATVSGGSGTDNHSELNELDYASAGHTGFASSEDLTNVSGTADANAANISTNTADIATNAANIATVSGVAAGNTTDIATNTSDIADNTASIAVVSGTADTNASDISTNADNIAQNAWDIAVVSGTADTNASDISTLDAKIDTTSGTLQTEIDGKDNYASWSFAVDGVTKDAITSADVLDFVGGDNITVTRSAEDQITISGSEGVTNHSELNELDYASAGHTGFASTEALTTTSGALHDEIISSAANTTATYYIHEDVSDIGGYELLKEEPSDDVESYDSVSIVAGDGETLIEPYVTVSGLPNTSAVAPGTWTWVLWASVSATSQGPHYLRAKWYRREQDGTEHYLFTQEQQITSTDTTRYLVETTTSGIDTALTDRFVVKMFAQTDATSSRTIGYYVEGTEHPTRFTTPIYTSLITDHGDLTGLADDDHLQYHTDARGDSRYYTETELDAGQLDNRYYTETELDAGQLDNRYYTETEVDTISGSLNTNIETNASDISTNASAISDNTTLIGTTSGTLQTAIDAKPDTLLELTDTPAAYDDGKYLKSTAVGAEWATVSGGSATITSGQHTVASGVSETSVTFSTEEDDNSYYIVGTMQNVTDSPPSIYGYVISTTTVSGFGVSFTGDIDSSNYKFNWHLSR